MQEQYNQHLTKALPNGVRYRMSDLFLWVLIRCHLTYAHVRLIEREDVCEVATCRYEVELFLQDLNRHRINTLLSTDEKRESRRRRLRSTSCETTHGGRFR
jgi:hypothetical protein